MKTKAIFKPQFPIVLASKSPRRHELMKLMGLEFSVALRETDESYPAGLNAAKVALHIAEQKASAFGTVSDRIIVTADTIVVLDNEILGKPKDRAEAYQMLHKLSGRKHEVYTGVCLMREDKLLSFFDLTEVYCRETSGDEINFYIDQFKPFDKAGSYGIQDWYGLSVVRRIHGSYTNVMGLPTEKLYEALKGF